MSVSNDGKWLERDIARICAVYREQGVMDVEKVDPPTKVVHPPGRHGAPQGAQRKPFTIQLANPFLDFVGSWTQRQGRAIFLEAKSTEEPKLTLRNSGGISEAQHDALERWAAAGAATGVLWGHDHQIRYVPMGAIRAQLRDGVKHVKWEHATPIPAGMGFVLWDFAATLGRYHPA